MLYRKILSALIINALCFTVVHAEISVSSADLGFHSLFNDNGIIYGAGSSEFGELAVSNYQVIFDEEPIDLPARAIKVETGRFRSAALLETGELYLFGRDLSTRPVPMESLGGEITDFDISNQGAWIVIDGYVHHGWSTSAVDYSRVEGLSNIVSVVALYDRLFAIDAEGSVYVKGDTNRYGALGTGDEEPRLYPVKIQGLPPIATISTNVTHTAFLDTNGQVWTVGRNIGLGYGVYGEVYLTPNPVENGDNVISISMGNDSLLVAKSDGTAWIAGGARLNEHYPAIHVTDSLVEIEFHESILGVEQGTQGAKFILTAEGNIYSWGGPYAIAQGGLGNPSQYYNNYAMTPLLTYSSPSELIIPPIMTTPEELACPTIEPEIEYITVHEVSEITIEKEVIREVFISPSIEEMVELVKVSGYKVKKHRSHHKNEACLSNTGRKLGKGHCKDKGVGHRHHVGH